MSLGPWQIVLILLVVVLLFGRGKIPALMGDVAQGIKSFKKGMSEDDSKKDETGENARVIEQGETESVAASDSQKDKA